MVTIHSLMCKPNDYDEIFSPDIIEQIIERQIQHQNLFFHI